MFSNIFIFFEGGDEPVNSVVFRLGRCKPAWLVGRLTVFKFVKLGS